MITDTYKHIQLIIFEESNLWKILSKVTFIFEESNLWKILSKVTNMNTVHGQI